MVIVPGEFRLGPRHAEEGLSSELEDEAAETPDVEGFVHDSGKN